MTPAQVVWLFRALALIAVVAFGFWVKAKYDELVTLRQDFKQAQLQIAQLKTQFEGFDETIAARVRQEMERRGVRAQINNRLEQVANEDQGARDYLGQRIPDSVRNAYTGNQLHAEVDGAAPTDADGRASQEP